MMNVVINNLTRIVEGVDITPSPMSSVIKVSNSFVLSKYIDVEEGIEQKTDEQGQPLFYNHVNKETYAEVVVGQDETTVKTDTPAMMEVQKTNKKGDKVYLEAIKDVSGKIIDYIEVTNPTSSKGDTNSPVMIQVQKMAKGAKPVYLIDIVEKAKVKVLDHIEESPEPSESPVMIPVVTNKYVSIFDHPELFNADEVIKAKHTLILSEHNKKEAWASVFMNSNELDIQNKANSASSGLGFILLPPKGTAVIKEVVLSDKVTELEILELDANNSVSISVNDVEFTDGKVTLPNESSTLVFKLTNTYDKSVQVSSVIVGY
jgi:hypothetical protein